MYIPLTSVCIAYAHGVRVGYFPRNTRHKKEWRRKVSFDEIKTFCYYQLLSNVSLSSALSDETI